MYLMVNLFYILQVGAIWYEFRKKGKSVKLVSAHLILLSSYVVVNLQKKFI